MPWHPDYGNYGVRHHDNEVWRNFKNSVYLTGASYLGAPLTSYVIQKGKGYLSSSSGEKRKASSELRETNKRKKTVLMPPIDAYFRARTMEHRRQGGTQGIAVGSGEARQGTEYHLRKKSRKTKKWDRFKHKVDAAIRAELPTQMLITGQTFQLTTATLGANAVGASSVYGNWTGTNQKDLDALFQAVTGSTAGNKPYDSAEINFLSCVADFDVLNISTTIAVFLDVYEVVPKGEIPATDFGSASNVSGDYNAGISDTTVIGTAMTIASRGATPFANPLFTASYSIINKERFVLPPGGMAHWQYKSQKDVKVLGEAFKNSKAMPFTRAWLYIAKNVDYLSVGTAILDISVSKQYHLTSELKSIIGIGVF